MKPNLWSSLVAQVPVNLKQNVVDAEELRVKRAALLAFWSEDPWNWMSGRDTDGRQILWTTDEKDQNAPVKPFPLAKPYLQQFVHDIHTHEFSMLDKCRQMIVSTATMLYGDWLCKFRDSRRIILSKGTEDEAIEMLQDKVRAVHRRLPEWIRAALPMRDKPMKKIRYPRTSSYILAANETVAKRAARGGTASVFIIDEGAFQDQFGQVVSAAQPMCDQIICISTANVSGPGARIYKLLMDEGKNEEAAA